MHRWSLLVALSLTLMACGGSEDLSTSSQPETAETSGTSTVSPSAETPAPSASAMPCDLLSEADVALVLGVDGASIQEAEGEAGRFGKGNTRDCVWQTTRDGIRETVTLYVRSRSENTPADAWSKAIQSFLLNGETLGSKTIAHTASDLGGTTGGALSEVHGGQYARARTYSWHVDEAVLYRLTITRSLEDAGAELVEPPVEHFEALVTAVMG